nr:LCP family protein [Ardenticatenales bacterium]
MDDHLARSERRRLSRTMPWQLPVVLLLLFLFLTLSTWRSLSAPRGEGPSAAPTYPVALDPLLDPSMPASDLEGTDQINILLLGTDGRDEEDGPPRTDLIMLLLLNRAEQRATLISIPRDLWVPIPGYGEGKINTAYFLGSLDDQATTLTRATVEQLSGLPVHHIVEVDFNGFRTLVDEMGGIEIVVPEPIDDPEYPDGNYGTLHLQIPAGKQQMDGE